MTTTNTAAETLKEIKELVDHVYSLKIESDRTEKEYQVAKGRLAEIMENAEVDKMAGDNCNASLSLKSSVTVPKEDHLKRDLFNYITTEHGEDVLFSMLTINPRSFSSWHGKEVERKMIEGELEFKLPMVTPYEYFSVGLRKRATKSKL
jgi:hypothetical protein